MLYAVALLLILTGNPLLQIAGVALAVSTMLYDADPKHN